MTKIALCLILSLAACGCEIAGKVANQVQGSGVRKTEKRDVPEFNALTVNGAYDVIIEAGKTRDVQLEGDDNILARVRTEVENGRLIVKNDGNFNTKTPLRLVISVPDIQDVSFHGASTVQINNVKNQKIAIHLDGASTIMASGETESLNIGLNGAGTINTRDLKANDVSVESNGAGTIEVYARNTLSATINGAGSVDYYGNPSQVLRQVNGAGTINKKSNAE